jgi:hypothetical protein
MARRLPTQVLFGLLVVAVGLVLLAETTGLYDARFLFDYVPSLFVLLGLYAMVRSGFRNLFGPAVVVAVAAAWQAVALDLVPVDSVWDFWPLVVVLFGLSLVLDHVRGRPSGDAARDGSDYVSTFAAFGGSEERSTSHSFTGASLTAAFGGVELDLRDAEVADPPARVNALAVFGGVEVYAPREWEVDLDVLPLFGGASDERPRPAPDTGTGEETDADPVDPVDGRARRTGGQDDREKRGSAPDLVVTGVAAFGGVTVN